MMRNMTTDDAARLDAHPLSKRLFKRLCDGKNGCTVKVADLDAAQYRHLRTLLELGYVSVQDGLCVIEFSISSLGHRGYLKW